MSRIWISRIGIFSMALLWYAATAVESHVMGQPLLARRTFTTLDTVLFVGMLTGAIALEIWGRSG